LDAEGHSMLGPKIGYTIVLGQFWICIPITKVGEAKFIHILEIALIAPTIKP